MDMNIHLFFTFYGFSFIFTYTEIKKDLNQIRKENKNMTERELYQEIEGKNEDGTTKAVISLAILTPNEEGEPEIEDSTTSMSGTVYLAIKPDSLSMIDVLFPSNTDADYLQFSGLCERYFETLADANRNGWPIPSLVMTVMPKGDFANSLNVIDCVWSYIPVTAEGVCSGLRFIAKTEFLNFISLSETEAYKLIDEIDDEA